MPDYRKMYMLLCKAVDDAIDPLNDIPEAAPIAQSLENALKAAEDVFISTYEN